MSAIGRNFKLLQVVAIGSWISLSLWGVFCFTADNFARLGAIGVVICILLYSPALVRASSEIEETSKKLDDLSKKNLNIMQAEVQNITRLNALSLCIFDVILNSVGNTVNPQSFSEKQRNEISAELKAYSIELTDRKVDLEKYFDSVAKLDRGVRDRKIKASFFQLQLSKYQIIPLILATIQWGYGDCLSDWIHSIGFLPCSP